MPLNKYVFISQGHGLFAIKNLIKKRIILLVAFAKNHHSSGDMIPKKTLISE